MLGETSSKLVGALLMGLFAYTFFTHLRQFEAFEKEMLNQPLPASLSQGLVYLILLGEGGIVLLLLVPKSRFLGLWLALLLLTAFTSYIFLIMAGAFERIPCSCAGIHRSLSWGQQAVINLIFIGLSMLGLILHLKKR